MITESDLEHGGQHPSLEKHPSCSLGMVFAMFNARSPFSTASPMAFDDAECEFKWDKLYMSGVAKRLSFGAKVMAVFILFSQLFAIFNEGTQPPYTVNL